MRLALVSLVLWPAVALAQPRSDVLDGMPAEAAVVAVIPSMASFKSALLLPDAVAARMLDDVDAYLSGHLGLSLRQVRGAAGFFDGQAAAVVVRGVSGNLRLPVAETYQGVPLMTLDKDAVAARVGDQIVLGQLTGVKLALDTLAGRHRGFAAGRPELAAPLGAESRGALLAVAVEVSALPPAMGAPPGLGVDRGVAALSGNRLRVVLGGPPTELPRVADQIRAFLKLVREEVTRERTARTQGPDIAEGVGAIVADHYVRYFASQAEPKLVGDHIRMEVGFETGEAALTVPMIGVLSAVAIPAFMKNARKAKATEAKANLMRIADGVDAARRGKRLPTGNVGSTPDRNCCDYGGKCPANPELWKNKVWKKLGFSIDEPHAYTYSYHSDGNAFQAIAQGDLDCDGNYDTVVLEGEVGADGKLERTWLGGN